MVLNPSQQAAVHRLGQDVCVVAGPGTGKTRVLIERFGWLVREQEIAPDRILAVTFTDKAATEIKSRLAEEFKDDEDRRREIERAYVSTIHGFCTRLLRENAIAAGVDIGFEVLDEALGARLLRESADQALDELLRDDPERTRQLMGAIAVSSRLTEHTYDLGGALIGVYGALRAAGDDWRGGDFPAIDPPDPAALTALVRSLVADRDPWHTPKQQDRLAGLDTWLSQAEPHLDDPDSWFELLQRLDTKLNTIPKSLRPLMKEARDVEIPRLRAALVTAHYAPLRELLITALRRLDTLYSERKRERSALDFADLEEYALHLLDSSEPIRRKLREQFDYILMDELQDTNPLQWKIIDRIRRPERFFAVGDVNQSIYGFRHADPASFEQYASSLSNRALEVDRLTTNYRSYQSLLDAVDWLTGKQPGILPSRLEADRGTTASPVVEVAVCRGGNREEGSRREAGWIAHRIAKLLHGGAPLKEIAVLGRKMKILEPIAAALQEAAIPYLVTGGRTLYETREARDLLHALRVLGNVHDEVALAGLLRSPIGGCSDETLFRLKLFRGCLWDGMAAALQEPVPGIDPDELARLRWLTALIGELRGRNAQASPDRLVSRILDESGYLTELDSQALANIERILGALRERFHATELPLAAVAAEFVRLRAAAPEAEAPPPEAVNAVRLLSIHASKGLEFQTVFVPGLESRPPNHTPAICRAPGHGIGVRWVEPVTGAGRGDIAHESVSETLSQRALAEEWRLLYVAMTRAKDRLLLSWATAERSRGSEWTKAILARLDAVGREEEGCDEELTDPETGARVRFAVIDRDPDLAAAPVPVTGGVSPAELAPPAVSGQHDSTVSVTELSVFADCPRRYYLERYLGLAARESSGGGAGAPGGTAIGDQVHKLLAEASVEDPHPEAVRLAEQARKSELWKQLEEADRREREFGFLMDLDGVVLRGQIDAWFEQAGEVTVVDYKTDRFDPNREVRRVTPYRLQLRFYTMALERMLGRRPARAVLYFIRPDKALEVDIGDEKMEEARDLLRRFSRAQERLEFPLCEGEHCRSCGYARWTCPADRPRNNSD